MLKRILLEHILFLDIETVPQHPQFSDLDPTSKRLWEQKTQYQRKEQYNPEQFYDRAGIWAEFGKIICISVGYFQKKGGIRNFRIRSFQGEERPLLITFKTFWKPVLIGHNICSALIMGKNSIFLISLEG